MQNIERSGRVFIPPPTKSEQGGGLEEPLTTATQRVVLPPPDPNPPPPKARLTIVGAIHHQSPEGTVTSAELSASDLLDSDEQPYVRHLRLGTNWTPLHLDWVKDPRIVVIRNKGITFQANPTEEQRQLAKNAAIEVGLRIGDSVEPFAVIGPWESLPFCPLDPSKISIRAVNTVTPISVYAFPR